MSSGLDFPVRVSARAHYAVMAATHLAGTEGRLVKGEEIARAQGIPPKFLVQILANLRHARLVWSHRGVDGGYRLARPAGDVTVADVVRAAEGSLTNVQGSSPRDALFPDGSVVRELWLALDAGIDAILGQVTLADLATGALPDRIVLASRQGTA